MRLFAICIAHGDSRLRESAATNLPALAATEKQKQQFRVMAFLYGNGQKVEMEVRQPAVSAEVQADLLKFVRSLRQEQFSQAAELLSNRSLKQTIESNGWFQIKDVESAIADRSIDPNLRVKLLKLERQLVLKSAGSPSSAKSKTIFETFDQPVQSATVPLSIREVVTFDLEATQYRDGKWVRP